MLIVSEDGGTSSLVEVPAPNEHHLQEMIKEHPELLPLEDLGLQGEMLVIGRETPLASGAIDLVGLTKAGDVLLVEFKTGPQNPDFRAALAQLLDYGSDLWGLAVSDFEHGVVQRFLAGNHCPPALKSAGSLRELANATWQIGDEDWDALVARLEQVLRSGDFYYIVAAQRFVPAMTRTLDYLAEVTRVSRYALVQVIKLDGVGSAAYSAQVVAKPSKPGLTATSQSVTNEQTFLTALPDGTYREAMQDILTAARTLGLSLEWGSKGTSIRLQTPEKPEPISVGWALPDGAQWHGLTHLSLGHPAGVAQDIPHLNAALQVYAAKVAQIPGATLATSKSLTARTFTPSAVAAAKDQIIAAIEGLVTDSSGDAGRRT